LFWRDAEPAASTRLLEAAACLWLSWMVGCAAPPLADRIALASEVAAAGGLTERRLATERFVLLGYWRPARLPGAGLRVYLEGDGLAWTSRRKISADPTPVDPVALRLAAADPTPRAILYLARPCQYLGAAEPPCGPAEWTDRRYSEEITRTIDQAIDHVLEESFDAKRGRDRAGPLEMVGYSGGGVLAANVSARRTDVALLVTVAAPLDLAGWVRHHDISPLLGSLDPSEQARALAPIPQLHFVGEEDENVPVALARSYLAALGNPERAEIIVVPGFGHRCCWARDWPALVSSLSAP
jgi:pimeloyl-ACP methyl ester carboxylesterase